MCNKFGFVYLTTCKVNNKKYIGKCQYNRKNDWRKYLGSGKKLKEDIIKYGKENFYKEILGEADNEDSLIKLEELYIKKYDAILNDNFYNMKPTSIGGDTFNYTDNKELTRLKMSQATTGIKNGMAFREKSDTFLKVISKKNSKGVIVDGILFKNVKDVCKQYEITHNEFRRVDFQRKHIIIFPNKTTIKNKTNSRKPIIIFGKEYSHKTDASKKLHMSIRTIGKRLDDPNNLDYVYK
ncbi:MAG: GIY-YIG nuclease family protein [Lactococcus hircilactis]